MLTSKEKEEFIQDGSAGDRKEDFRKVPKGKAIASPTLDNYIQFLDSLLKFYSSATVSPKKTVTNIMKL